MAAQTLSAAGVQRGFGIIGAPGLLDGDGDRPRRGRLLLVKLIEAAGLLDCGFGFQPSCSRLGLPHLRLCLRRLQPSLGVIERIPTEPHPAQHQQSDAQNARRRKRPP
ncbi:hypothetical protein [Brevundimonas nasdae]|uniref:hypothetical protein n=1 Tax=Brevundimonas nasdae TaxID=172043 RepID=UPI003F694376